MYKLNGKIINDNENENEYDIQAKDFMNKYNVKMNIDFEGKKQVKMECFGNVLIDYYKVVIKRNGKQMTTHFGQSLNDTRKGIPARPYDILSCIQKYPVEYYEDFCDEYGYNKYNEFGGIDKKSEEIYLACLKEWKNVDRLFGDILEELQEIQ